MPATDEKSQAISLEGRRPSRDEMVLPRPYGQGRSVTSLDLSPRDAVTATNWSAQTPRPYYSCESYASEIDSHRAMHATFLPWLCSMALGDVGGRKRATECDSVYLLNRCHGE